MKQPNKKKYIQRVRHRRKNFRLRVSSDCSIRVKDRELGALSNDTVKLTSVCPPIYLLSSSYIVKRRKREREKREAKSNSEYSEIEKNDAREKKSTHKHHFFFLLENNYAELSSSI